MTTRSIRRRRGIAFLMLVFMLLVIIMGCVQLMIQQEVSDRRFSRQKCRSEILRSAIDVATEMSSDQTITLPVNDDPEQKVLVRYDETADSWVATWLEENSEIDSVMRKKTK